MLLSFNKAFLTVYSKCRSFSTIWNYLEKWIVFWQVSAYVLNLLSIYFYSENEKNTLKFLNSQIHHCLWQIYLNSAFIFKLKISKFLFDLIVIYLKVPITLMFRGIDLGNISSETIQFVILYLP